MDLDNENTYWDESLLDDDKPTDPATKPDLSVYERVTLGEILEKALEFPGSVDWEELKILILDHTKSLLGSWEEMAKADFLKPPILPAPQNLDFLYQLRKHLASQLSSYREITDGVAWVVWAYEQLEVLKVQFHMTSSNFLRKNAKYALKNQIEDLELEISQFEDDWCIFGQIYELESYLLKCYSRQVVHAQKRVAKFKLKQFTLEENDPKARQKSKARHVSLGKYGPKPGPKEIRTPYAFEYYCRDWLAYLGSRNAEVSQASQDGGVDIFSDEYVAQVKLYNGPVPVAQIRDLLGTSVDFRKKPIFFASMAFSRGAIEFADRNGIPLVIVDSFNGVLRGANSQAQTLIQMGVQL